MTAQPWEVPIARLQGAFEQLGKRLESMDRRLDSMDRRLDGMDRRLDSMDHRLGGMDQKIDGNFRATIGWMVGQTAVLLAALAAVAFTLHR